MRYAEIKHITKVVKDTVKNATIDEVRERYAAYEKKCGIDPEFNESMRKVLRDSRSKGARSVAGAKDVIVN